MARAGTESSEHPRDRTQTHLTRRRASIPMNIESVDFFYASMPEVTLEADGSQDTLLVRVTAGGHVGWGECEASPLTSIAAFVTPRSHGVCQPVSASVLGENLDGPADIQRIAALRRANSMDLLQAAAHLVGHRDRTVGPARPRCVKSRCGGCSATRRATASSPTLRCCSAIPRRRRWTARSGRARERTSARSSSAGAPTAPGLRRMTPTMSRPPARVSATTAS